MKNEFRNLQFQKHNYLASDNNVIKPNSVSHSIFKNKNSMKHKNCSFESISVLQKFFRKKTILKKGQYDLINEIILFAIGLAITSFIIVNFSKIENTSSALSINDSFKAIANQIGNAVVKVYNNPESSISLEIPDKIQEKVYSISLDEASSSVIVKTLDNKIIASQQLFNISKRNDIIISRSVVSSAKFIEITMEDGEIIVRRAELYD